MYDLRKYKYDIMRYLRGASYSDRRWKWSVRNITKTQIRINWGYLKSLNVEKPFVIKLVEQVGEVTLVIRDTNGDMLDMVCIGDGITDDMPTIDGGLVLATQKLVDTMLQLY